MRNLVSVGELLLEALVGLQKAIAVGGSRHSGARLQAHRRWARDVVCVVLYKLYGSKVYLSNAYPLYFCSQILWLLKR